jgi:hypothetical protein
MLRRLAAARPRFCCRKTFFGCPAAGEGRRPGTIGAYLYDTPGSQRAHFVGPANTTCLLIRAAKTSYTAGTLGEIGAEFFVIFLKNIDNNIKPGYYNAKGIINAVRFYNVE